MLTDHGSRETHDSVARSTPLSLHNLPLARALTQCVCAPSAGGAGDDDDDECVLAAEKDVSSTAAAAFSLV